MPSPTPSPVLIVGAGIGGLCLAQGLRRAGIEVAVYERDRSRTDRLDGYRIHIDPDGAGSLRACLPVEVWEKFVSRTVDLGGFRFLDHRLNELLVLEEAASAEAVGPTDRSHAIDRVTLREVLMTGLDDVLHFDKKFTRYESGEDGKVTAFFADGTSATADVLIGADGVNSRVRSQLLPQAQRIDTEALGVGFKLPLTDEVRSWLSDPLATGRNMIMGPAPYFLSISVFERSLDASDGAPEPASSGSGSYVGTAFVARRTACPPDIQGLGGPQLQRVVATMLADWHPQLQRIVSESDADSALVVPYLTSEPLEPWDSANITLLGDAVHSMPPVGGLGGNTALRDADLLRQKLIEVRDGGAALVPAIHEYEAAMLKYGFEAVRKALRYQKQGLRGRRVGFAVTKAFFRAANAMKQRRRAAAGAGTDRPGGTAA